MPTISDLNAAFAELEQQAPTKITSLAAPTHQATVHRLPRRGGAVLAGVVGVAACVAAAAVVVSSGALSGGAHNGHPNAAIAPASGSHAAASKSVAVKPVDSTPLPLTENVYTVGKLPAGMSVYTTYASSDYQEMTFTLKSGVDAWISTASAWRPSVPADAVRVTVGGHPGYYARDFGASGALGVNMPLNQATAPGVLWQAGSGRWGFVTQPGLDVTKRAELSNAQYVAIANAIHVGQNRPFTTPVKFGYLPENLKLSEAMYIGAPGSDVRYVFQPTVLSGYVLEVEISQGRYPMGTIGTQQLNINGWSGPYGANEGNAVFTKNGVSVTLSKNDGGEGPGNGFPLTDVKKILSGLQVAPAPGTASSWFALANALPAATR